MVGDEERRQLQHGLNVICLYWYIHDIEAQSITIDMFRDKVSDTVG